MSIGLWLALALCAAYLPIVVLFAYLDDLICDAVTWVELRRTCGGGGEA